MTPFVVDASVAVEYLLRTPLGLTLSDLLESSSLVAPELIDAEVLSVLRRGVLNGHLTEQRALAALADMTHWPLERVPHRELVYGAWLYFRNVSAYDAFYIAAARGFNIPLLTADRRLARTPGLDITIHQVRMGQDQVP